MTKYKKKNRKVKARDSGKSNPETSNTLDRNSQTSNSEQADSRARKRGIFDQYLDGLGEGTILFGREKKVGKDRLDTLKAQCYDPLWKNQWTDGTEPLNKIGDPRIFVQNIAIMMEVLRTEYNALNNALDTKTLIKNHENSLKKLRGIHKLYQSDKASGSHLPVGVSEAMERYWDKMAERGAIAEQSWEAISQRLRLLAGEHTGEESIPELENGQLVMDVMLRSAIYKSTTRDARKLKDLFRKCILERERIDAQMALEQIQRKKVKADETLKKINKTIQDLEKPNMG